MENSKMVNTLFNIWVKEAKYKFRMGTLRDKKYPLLKEKHKEKISKFLYKTFNLNNNYIIESSLNNNVKIYQNTSNQNILIVELDFLKGIKSKLFTNFQIKVQSSTSKDNNSLEKNIALGKISKILLIKKDIILEKYNKLILNWEKDASINKQKYENLRDKAIKLKIKIYLYKIKYINQNIFSKKGILIRSHNLNLDNLYPHNFKKITFVKSIYLKNKKIEVILKSDELNKTYTYIISQENHKKLLKEYIDQISYINGINDVIDEKWKQYKKENHEYLKTL